MKTESSHRISIPIAAHRHVQNLQTPWLIRALKVDATTMNEGYLLLGTTCLPNILCAGLVGITATISGGIVQAIFSRYVVPLPIPLRVIFMFAPLPFGIVRGWKMGSEISSYMTNECQRRDNNIQRGRSRSVPVKRQ